MTDKKRPKRIRRVLSITLHPTAIEMLDARAAQLNVSRSKMIERLALTHCGESDEEPELEINVKWSYLLGFQVEQNDNMTKLEKR